MVSEKIDQVKSTTVTKTNPSSKKGNLKIEILHVNVHPTREGHITWTYQDGTSEKITMHGNGGVQGTRFKNSNDNWSDWVHDKKDYTDRVVEHMGLTKQYKFEKVDRQPGKNGPIKKLLTFLGKNGPRNSWVLETKSGGVESVEISNPVHSWGGFTYIDLTWTSSERSPLAKGTAMVKIEEPVKKPRMCCRAP